MTCGAVGIAISEVGVEGAGDVNEAGGVVGDVFVAVAVGDGVGIEGMGSVSDAGGVVVEGAVAGVGVIVVETQGRRGASDI